MALFDQFPYTNLHELNLDWILCTLKKMCAEIDLLQHKYDELKEQFDQLSDNLGEEVDKWLREQGKEYVQEILKEYIATSVYFGLTPDGYWTAYIPSTWNSIQFETTGLDVDVPIQPEYGHLVLAY